LSTELSAYAYSFLFSEKLLKFMYEICSYCFINEISPVQTHLPLPDFSYTTLFRIPTIKMVITILVVMSKISLNLGLRKRQDYKKKRKKKGKIKKTFCVPHYICTFPKRRAALQSIILSKEAY
jgi:hypothetical protein